MTKTHEALAAEFLDEIKVAIARHEFAYNKDALSHQAIIIVSALCGFLSLVWGTAWHDAITAGIFGGVTTLGSILTQTLHCVKAQGWQDTMRSELKGLRIKFEYEYGSAPTKAQLAKLGKEYRELQSKMAKEWERIISSQSGGLNIRFSKKAV